MTDHHPKAVAATPRLDAIEAQQNAIHDLLSHLVNGRQTSEESDPFIHVRAGDEKWNICLSRFAKWVGGIVAVVVAASLIAALGFAWNGAVAMARVSDQLENINDRLDRLGIYVAKVDAKLEHKADRP